MSKKRNKPANETARNKLNEIAEKKQVEQADNTEADTEEITEETEVEETSEEADDTTEETIAEESSEKTADVVEDASANTDNLSNRTSNSYWDTDTLAETTDNLYAGSGNLYSNTDNLTGDGHPVTVKKKKNILLDNLGLKILALMCSFVIWFVVMNLEDGVVTKTVYDIPVQMENGDAITDRGNLYNITEGEKVDVIVKGPRSTVENLEAENFDAVADLSHLSVTNSTTIEVTLNNTVLPNRSKKVSITPINQYVTLSIEEEVEKSVPVRVITTGSAANGYAIGSVIPTPNMITVSGPESVLSNIVEARAVVDVNGSYEDIERVVRVGCIDGYGAAVEKDNVTLSASEVTITIPVYETKEVPVNVTTAGKVHEGYGIRSINFEPSTVVIAGDKEILDTISSIDIKDVLVTDATTNIEKNLDIVEYLPSNVFVADSTGSEIAVSVELGELMEQEKVLNPGDIRITGGAYEMNYEILDPQPLKIKIQGFEEDITDIDIVSLNPRVNVEGLKAGKYDLEIEFDTSETYTIKDTYKVKIEVTEPNP